MTGENKDRRGVLCLCGMPIGNLEDITLRAIRLMKEADLIAAEDTRNSLRLLNYYQIRTPMTSYHEHNRKDKGKKLLDMLRQGKSIVLISDAGMPGISDPGEDLVAMCHEEEIRVTVVPGACAGIAALVISGIESRRFCFEGFLPRDKREQRRVLEELRGETRSIVLYEAPHRLKNTLACLRETLGERQISLCRELTKRYEEVMKTTLSESLAYFEESAPRGEYVLVVQGKSFQKTVEEKRNQWRDMPLEAHMDYYTRQGMDSRDAMKCVAKDRGEKKREIYQRLLNGKE